MLKKAAERKELVQVALNTHGTRAVQKLIETLTTREQVRRAGGAGCPAVISHGPGLNLAAHCEWGCTPCVGKVLYCVWTGTLRLIV